jgi:RNA polymerase sigma-70 factor (ECF subfamily)
LKTDLESDLETDGDEAALFRRYGSRIRLYGLRPRRDRPAAGARVQQVLVVVIQSLRSGKVRDLDRLDSFVLGTCRMIARDQRRTEQRRRRILDQNAGEEAIERESSSSLDLARLKSCVEGLPARERAVVALSFYAERSGEEIATELGMSSGNVRVVRHRAVGHLKDCMGVEVVR